MSEVIMGIDLAKGNDKAVDTAVVAREVDGKIIIIDHVSLIREHKSTDEVHNERVNKLFNDLRKKYNVKVTFEEI